MATAHAGEGETPARGAAPTLGLVLTGVALIGSVLPWTGDPPLLPVSVIEGSAVAATLALGATLSFSLRRHGTLDRPAGSAVAGLCALGVAVVALARLVTPALGAGSTPTVAIGLPIAGVAGLSGAVVAVADGRAVTDDLLWTQVRAVAVALLVGLCGFLTSTLVAYGVVLPALLVPGFSTAQSYPLITAGSGIGLGLFALGYLRYRELDFDYIDLGWPDRRDVGYTIGGLVLLFVVSAFVSVVFTRLGLPTADSSIERLAQEIGNPDFLLLLIPLSWLAVGPGEELVYRNVVQKYLYDYFSRPTAVVVASVGFAAIHFQQYQHPDPIATLSTLCLVFTLSLVLGYSYYRSENLLVPILIHGTFNAVQFAILYLELSGTLSVP